MTEMLFFGLPVVSAGAVFFGGLRSEEGRFGGRLLVALGLVALAAWAWLT